MESSSRVMNGIGLLRVFCRFTALALVFGISPGGAWAATPADTGKSVDSIFAAWDKPDSPGCVVGVVRDGKFAYTRGFGMADISQHVPNSPATVFNIGSTSKQFTAAC